MRSFIFIAILFCTASLQAEVRYEGKIIDTNCHIDPTMKNPDEVVKWAGKAKVDKVILGSKLNTQHEVIELEL